MSDQEFAAWMRTLPREKSPEEVERLEHRHERERAPWGVADHHEFEESRH